MLESIRAVQNTWVGKTVLTVIMGLIMVSFVIWGIGPVFTGFNANTLATVGSDTVTVDAFRQAYQTELQQLQQRTRRPISSAQAHQYGLDTQVLSRLVSDAVLDDRARTLGLAISQGQIVKAITTDPAFAGPNGQFDRDRFTQLLRQNDMTEQGFVRDQRNVDLRQELIQGMVGGLAAPQAATEALHALQTETRSIDAVTLQAAVADVPAPDEASLQKFFDAHPASFRAPEYRKLVVLPILPAAVAKPDEVPETDVQALYDRTKEARFSTPETRSVQQIVFPNEPEALAAAAALKGGTSFADLAAERKLTDKDIDLGRLTRTGAYDKGVAEAAFALPAGGVSEPVTTPFGAALVHVTAIEPGSVKPLEEVAAALRLEIASGRTGGAIRALHDKVEDARAAGRSLTEAATAAGLPVTTVDAVDAAGRGPEGQPVALPDGPALLKAAFASDIGVDNDTLRTPDGGEIFFEVAGIERARPKTFAEVRPAVEGAWRKDEAMRKLAETADGMVKALEAGKSLDELAAANGNLPVQHVADVRRSGGTGLAPTVAAAVFEGPVGHAGSAAGGEDTRVVFKVLGTVVPTLDPDSQDVKAMASQYQAALADEVVTTYLNDVQSRLGVRVNPAAFSAAIGGRLMDVAGVFVPDGAFAQAYAAGRPSLVATQLVGDLETPVSAFLKLSQGRRGNVFLLESVEGGATRGRYSMIGLDPDVIWRCTGERAEIDREALSGEGRFVPCPGAPLDALRALLAESAIPSGPGEPPMAAGVFGYLGYDMVRQMERLAPAKPDPIGVPDAIMIRPTVMVVFDAVRDEISVVSPVRPRADVSARAAHAAATLRLDAVVVVLEGPLLHAGSGADPRLLATPPDSNTGTPAFLAMVERAKDYIRAGDIFQVVLSQRYSAPFDLPPFALYRALRRVNPAPYLSFLDFGAFQICCSSPEILVRVRGGEVTIRPIAGTRRRGDTPEADKALEAELLADPKERSEHLMLLDLGRNDVGRVAAIGSVAVTDSFFVERYSHVMHIVSNVVGRLGGEHDVIDALAAGFPAGTVSGAPKVRAMEIIDELEREKRGIYGGCIGYFGAGGEMDTCIVLRTSVIKDGTMHVQAGAGIVYDSVPESEDAECANKARALVRAAEEAVRFASAARQGQ